jgi:hypothetical protein
MAKQELVWTEAPLPPEASAALKAAFGEALKAIGCPLPFGSVVVSLKGLSGGGVPRLSWAAKAEAPAVKNGAERRMSEPQRALYLNWVENLKGYTKGEAAPHMERLAKADALVHRAVVLTMGWDEDAAPPPPVKAALADAPPPRRRKAA